MLSEQKRHPQPLLLEDTPRGYVFLCMNTPTTNQSIDRRLSIIEGQVRGLRELIAQGAYCIDVITQTSAVKQALSGVEDLLLENHLGTCAINQIKKGHEEKAVEEILKVYKLKRK